MRTNLRSILSLYTLFFLIRSSKSRELKVPGTLTANQRFTVTLGEEPGISSQYQIVLVEDNDTPVSVLTTRIPGPGATTIAAAFGGIQQPGTYHLAFDHIESISPSTKVFGEGGNSNSFTVVPGADGSSSDSSSQNPKDTPNDESGAASQRSTTSQQISNSQPTRTDSSSTSTSPSDSSTDTDTESTPRTTQSNQPVPDKGNIYNGPTGPGASSTSAASSNKGVTNGSTSTNDASVPIASPTDSSTGTGNNSTSSDRLSIGAIIAMVLCLLVVLLIIGLLVRYRRLRRRSDKQNHHSTSLSSLHFNSNLMVLPFVWSKRPPSTKTKGKAGSFVSTASTLVPWRLWKSKNKEEGQGYGDDSMYRDCYTKENWSQRFSANSDSDKSDWTAKLDPGIRKVAVTPKLATDAISDVSSPIGSEVSWYDHSRTVSVVGSRRESRQETV